MQSHYHKSQAGIKCDIGAANQNGWYWSVPRYIWAYYDSSQGGEASASGRSN